MPQLYMKPKLERAEAETREEVEADAEVETRRSANEDAERDAEKAGKVRGPAEWKTEPAESDTSNESQLLELVYEERDVESYLL